MPRDWVTLLQDRPSPPPGLEVGIATIRDGARLTLYTPHHLGWRPWLISGIILMLSGAGGILAAVLTGNHQRIMGVMGLGIAAWGIGSFVAGTGLAAMLRACRVEFRGERIRAPIWMGFDEEFAVADVEAVVLVTWRNYSAVRWTPRPRVERQKMVRIRATRGRRIQFNCDWDASHHEWLAATLSHVLGKPLEQVEETGYFGN